MTLLLDTQVLLWASEGNSKLPNTAVDFINNADNELLFSAASIWEIVIKSSLGRDDFVVNPYLLRSRLLENGYRELSVTADHALAVTTLPSHHKDPFDRLLVAQASVEGFLLLTADKSLASYTGPIIVVT